MAKIICRVRADGPEGEGIPVVEAGMEGGRIVEGVVPAREHDFYSDDSKQFSAGVAAYEPGTIELTNWPVEEFCVVISGALEITDSGGKTEKFGPGDAFVIPKGFSGTWQMPEPFKKYWAVFAPQ